MLVLSFSHVLEAAVLYFLMDYWTLKKDIYFKYLKHNDFINT